MTSNYAVYWDSSVFLSWINHYPERTITIEGMWNEVTIENEGKVYTSSISLVEVAKAEIEQNHHKVYQDVEQRIDGLWADSNIQIVEANSFTMLTARRLIRQLLPFADKKQLKPMDAIHLATALFIEKNGILLQEINTYDESWFSWQNLVNISILEPHYTPKPKQLDLDIPDSEY